MSTLDLFGWNGKPPTDTPSAKAEDRRARADAKQRPSIDQRFAELHSKNPHIAKEMLRLARVRLDRGETFISAKALWEELRVSLTRDEAGGHGPFETTEGKLAVSPYKLDNSLCSLFSRTIIRMEPRLAGVIEVRKRKGEK